MEATSTLSSPNVPAPPCPQRKPSTLPACLVNLIGGGKPVPDPQQMQKGTCPNGPICWHAHIRTCGGGRGLDCLELGGGGGGSQQSSDPVRSQQLFYGLDSVLVAYFQHKGERCLFQVELSLRVTAHRYRGSLEPVSGEAPAARGCRIDGGWGLFLVELSLRGAARWKERVRSLFLGELPLRGAA